MIYLVDKLNNELIETYDNVSMAELKIQELGRSEDEFVILNEYVKTIIPKIYKVGDVVVYNDNKFWTSTEAFTITDYYQYVNGSVIDYKGNNVSLEQYREEYIFLKRRFNSYNGYESEIAMNIRIAPEIISLFRQECIDTDFNDGTSPMTIFYKMGTLIAALNAGAFREAGQLIPYIERDSFLTDERLAKYADLIASSDSITYADMK